MDNKSARMALHTAGVAGHRQSYLDLCAGIFNGERVAGKNLISTPKPLLFLMIEDGFGLYVGVGLLRAILGRRTVGLLFRPLPAVRGTSLRLRLKRIILRGLKRVPAVQTLSIVPFSVAPEIARVADGWVHDLQLWDMDAKDRGGFAALRAGQPTQPDADAFYAQIRAKAAGRKTVVSLGAQSREKGIAILAEAAASGRLEDWCIVVAGKVAADMHDSKATLEAKGHLVIDRYLSDAEIIAAYAAADAMWCLYDPAYDQASGILGRALQFGVRPLVRAGSISEKLCRAENVIHAAAQGAQDCGTALAALPPAAHAGLATDWKSENVARINAALFGQDQAPL